MSGSASQETANGVSARFRLSRNFILPVLAGMLFILGWYVVKYVARLPSFIFPSPGEIAAAAIRERSTLWHGALITASGAVLGFVLAAVAALAASLVISLSPLIRLSIFPYILMLQMMPIVVKAPVIILWFGPGLPSTVAIAFLISFFPIVISTTQGLVSTDRNMVDLFQIGAKYRWQEILWLRLPFALPYFLTGLRIAGSLAPMAAIAGEFFSGNSTGGTGGLGFLVVEYNSQMQISELFAAGFTACALGLIFYGIVAGLNWWLLRNWHDSFAGQHR
jgi:NitT/TauT family transport system permease protein